MQCQLGSAVAEKDQGGIEGVDCRREEDDDLAAQGFQGRSEIIHPCI